MFMRPWVSETPAMPSSPQRKALERAMSYVKWLHASPLSLQIVSQKVPSRQPGWSNSRVVLTDSSPLSLGHVGTVFLPVLGTVVVLFEPTLLDAGNVVLVNDNHDESLAP
jgi:hypothetical protein